MLTGPSYRMSSVLELRSKALRHRGSIDVRNLVNARSSLCFAGPLMPGRAHRRRRCWNCSCHTRTTWERAEYGNEIQLRSVSALAQVARMLALRVVDYEQRFCRSRPLDLLSLLGAMREEPDSERERPVH